MEIEIKYKDINNNSHIFSLENKKINHCFGCIYKEGCDSWGCVSGQCSITKNCLSRNDNICPFDRRFSVYTYSRKNIVYIKHGE